ncbi:hypothetical protein [Neorhizobium galegae]|uniref:hypothetical protein n=1 Tax=Neorhizobium galegae TaxID=399 RepID=UPI001FD985DA|nr:hypothetical protein [Neorhizobium galegae]
MVGNGDLAQALHDAQIVETGGSERQKAFAIESGMDGLGLRREMPEAIAVEDFLQERCCFSLGQGASSDVHYLFFLVFDSNDAGKRKRKRLPVRGHRPASRARFKKPSDQLIWLTKRVSR